MQGFKTFTLYGVEVDKDILSTVAACDEAKSLFLVEPFARAGALAGPGR